MASPEDKQFLLELAALLDKYKMTISYTCDSCSDTYGITGEKMEIYNDKNKTIFETGSDTYLDANNVRENIKD